MASIPFENAPSAAANNAPAESDSVEALFELSHMTLFVILKREFSFVELGLDLKWTSKLIFVYH